MLWYNKFKALQQKILLVNSYNNMNIFCADDINYSS